MSDPPDADDAPTPQRRLVYAHLGQMLEYDKLDLVKSAVLIVEQADGQLVRMSTCSLKNERTLLTRALIDADARTEQSEYSEISETSEVIE